MINVTVRDPNRSQPLIEGRDIEAGRLFLATSVAAFFNDQKEYVFVVLGEARTIYRLSGSAFVVHCSVDDGRFVDVKYIDAANFIITTLTDYN